MTSASASPYRTIIPCGLLLLLGSCGFGTAAIVSATDGGGTTTGTSASFASTLLAPRSLASPASIFFVMTDLEGDAADVQIGFRTQPTGDFQPITLAAGSPPLVGVPSSTTPYRVQWDFAADLGGAGYRQSHGLHGCAPPTEDDRSE